MKYNHIILGIIFAANFFSCRPDPIEIKLPPLEPEVVVFSQVIPDEVMTVSLTRTLDALEFSEEEGDTVNQNLLDNLVVTEATVTVSYRDVIDTLFELGAGFYASVSTPQYVNENYTLKVETQDDKILMAQNKMLPIVEFTNVTPIIENDSVKIDFTINDVPDDNWYMLNFYKQGDGQPDGIDLNSFFSFGSNLLVKTELLDDDAFNGNTFEGSIELPNVERTDSLVVTLSNISEKYYRFLEIRETSENIFTTLTKEPVSLPTNVEGGLGFFNTHFPDIKYFDLNDY